MKSPLLSSITGYVFVELKGGRIEVFLNEAVAAGVRPWDVRFRKPELAELKLPLAHFFRLRPLLKRTGCRVHVKERHGLPFVLDRLGRRKMFAVGFAVFLAGLFFLTSLVWTVSVEGNEKMNAEDILAAARAEGVRPLQWVFRMQPGDELSRRIHRRLPEASWVGVERHGTRVVIKVAESTLPEKREPVSPRNLVAGKNALVTRIFAEKGRKLVQPNTYVRKGDVLISGVLGNEQYRKVVPAEGKVYGLVWYISDVVVPKVQTHRTLTGESFERSYLVFGNRALQLTGYGKDKYAAKLATGERSMLRFQNWGLPVGWLTEKVSEVRENVIALTDAEAEKMGLARAGADLLRKAGPEATIATTKVLNRRIENGELHLRVHFEVEELIQREEPLVEPVPQPPTSPSPKQ